MGSNHRLAARACFALGVVVAGNAVAAEPPASTSVGTHGEIVVVATLAVKPEEEAGFERASRRSIACTRLDPGNVTYSISKVITSGAPPTYVVYQVWKDAASLRNHFHQPYMQALVETYGHALLQPPAMSFAAELAPAPTTGSSASAPIASPDCR